MSEHDPLIGAYEHLNTLPRAPEALHSLRKIASLVKPIMRNRGWRVGILTEFYPGQTNLLGLNVNRGRKICLRLRYPGDQRQFLPIEQVVDTMLHELSHNVHGPHHEAFHKLWIELRDEYEDLIMKGYTGEGFLTEGHRLGGRRIPVQEMRRQARAAAERRKILTKGSGQKLGGAPVMQGVDMRQVIAEAATRRTNHTLGITQGCASLSTNAVAMADQASRNGFRTKAEEKDANDRAIAQALWELVQEDEARKVGVADDDWRTEGLTWSSENALQQAAPKSGQSAQGLETYLKAEKTEKPISRSPPVKTESKPVPSTTAIQPTPNSSTQPPPRTTAFPEPKKRSFTEIAPPRPPASLSAPQMPTTWSCPVCTLVNPIDYLGCDACGSERPYHIKNVTASSSSVPPAYDSKGSREPSSKISVKGGPVSLLPEGESERRKEKLGWNCGRCGTFMETQWWTCSLCGRMKDASK